MTYMKEQTGVAESRKTFYEINAFFVRLHGMLQAFEEEYRAELTKYEDLLTSEYRKFSGELKALESEIAGALNVNWIFNFCFQSEKLI